jgi:MraZ protein
MKVLCGEYLLTVDEKNRLLVPAEVRRFFDVETNGSELFVVIGQNRKPWIYHGTVYAGLADAEKPELAPDANSLAFDQMYYSMATPVEMDKAGRMLVPQHIKRRTKLETEITMIGVKDHLELWNRADWDKRIDELLDQGPELAAQKRKSNNGNGDRQGPLPS